ncbi:MAG: hypothetical protein CMH64_00660 [Nanoarchaeota archaeon]|nr:hypothetical protein [Nanoarchaeota archaeon]|tara:strand:- start:1020 stop:1229 length:210 start_codon:yes stop_codon:yes gene_type:complete
MSLEEKYQTVVREVREKGMGNHPSIRGPMVDLHTTYRYYGHNGDCDYSRLTLLKKIGDINAAIKAVGGN